MMLTALTRHPALRSPVFMLLVLTLALLPSKSLYNIPVGLLAVGGLWLSFRQARQLLSHKLIRAYVIVFSCVWVPMLFSLADAVAPAQTATSVFAYLRFLFAGICVLASTDREQLAEWLQPVVFVLVGFWSLDACIQFLTGTNLAGYPYRPGFITGMFHPRNTIAHVLAALTPVFLDALCQYGAKRRWLWLLVIPLSVVILLSGSRASWVMILVGIPLWLWYRGLLSPKRRRALISSLLVLMLTLIIAVVMVSTNTPLQKRLAETAGLLSLDYDSVNRATAYRLPIWETAVNIGIAQPVNGIGVRGFRHAYTDYSRTDDIWHLTGTTHPHQMLLEVLAETGVIGITGLLVFLVMIVRPLIRRLPIEPGGGWLISAMIILFPINTTLAFYGSYWSTLIWSALMLAWTRLPAPDNPA